MIDEITIKDNNKLWKKDSYTMDVDYIIGTRIIEYDMKEAGFNLAKYYKLLPQEKIKILNMLTKYQRKVTIGIYMRDDKKFNRQSTKSFGLMRKNFFRANNLEEKDILAIKKDAIFVIGKVCNNTKFGNIEFVPKNKYTSFHKFGNTEFYFNKNKGIIDVKGINDELLKLHNEYMLNELKKLFGCLESGNNELFVKMMKKFATDYKNKNLNIGYYRELNALSVYTLNEKFNISDYYLIGLEEDDDVTEINIAYNYLNYIRPMIQRHYFIGVRK